MTDKTNNYQVSNSWATDALPNFKQRKVLILPGTGYFAAVKMFTEANFTKAETVEDADVICFLGGADVSPSLYGQKPVSEVTYCDTSRDDFEKKVFEKAKEQGKICFGICRGAQLLHVLNGGSLWQHVDNHAGKPHSLYDIEEDVVLEASSLHHQMMKYNNDMDLLAVPNENVATLFKDENLFINLKHKSHKEEDESCDEIEVEACTYPTTKTLCIQGHPEMGPAKFRSWSMYKLHDYVVEWERNREKGNSEIVKQVIDQIG